MDASKPAVSAPMKAASADGIWVKSMSSSRNVLAAAPISAAVAAIGMALLNMIEKPKTPQKLVMIRRNICKRGSMFMAAKSTGFNFSSKAMIHANIVTTKHNNDRVGQTFQTGTKISLARSMPLVIKGKPGMINNMEQI